MSGFSLGSVFPDSLHLLSIKSFTARQTFCDENSLETSTGNEKRKYKLATNIFPEMGVFTFVLSTSEQAATSNYTTVHVLEHEWEDRHPEYLHGSSFFDVKKIQVHNMHEILKKRKDAQNGFKQIAILPERIYPNFQRCFKRARSKTSVPIGTINLMNAAYEDASVAEHALKDLGLL